MNEPGSLNLGVGPVVPRHARRGERSIRPVSGSGLAGFTLLELMFALAVIGILTVLAIGQYSQYADRARNSRAIADIATMELEIARFQSRQFTLPDTLTDIGRGAFLDPWQRPYVYTKLAGVNGHGRARKDRRLNPLNSDYDLFSAGKNGVFNPQVSNKDSLDDIIRARDGGFIGLAEEF